MSEHYSFTFTAEQLVVIDRAIQQMPFHIAAPLLNDINKQISNQNKQTETKD